MGIRVERSKRRGPDLGQVASELEESIAELSAADIRRVWPRETGKSAPVAEDNAVVFRAPYARYVRRPGASTPLMETTVPEIVRTTTREVLEARASDIALAALQEF